MDMAAAANEREPMMEINTTPLIDVMLVLLIMFIITVPIQTHAVKIDLPRDSTVPPDAILDPVKNRIVVTDEGGYTWNGTPVTLVTARQYLDRTTRMASVPELHLRPEPGAPYVAVDELLAVVKRAGVTSFGFVGNEAYATF